MSTNGKQPSQLWQQSNNTADAPRAVIFVKNGDYDFGSEEQTLRAYNVSIVGESREGVILHGNPHRYLQPHHLYPQRTGTYFQDLTIRNDLDFGADKRQGVGAAFYGGNKDILSNVALQSIQDTYVTGSQELSRPLLHPRFCRLYLRWRRPLLRPLRHHP
ncbi:hypothetical protein [Muribaculum intestinale]|uniref:hypothetical protein n=1 Tax=Muribaculum intestinale TaxID=1796646 RepID=UPI003F66BC93